MSHSICVYCSSSDAVDEKYFQIAGELGRLIGERGWELIYGGATVGLMGYVAKVAQKNGANVVGIIPKSLGHIKNELVDELVVCQDLRERKAIMEERSTAFMALPGGFGTLDEVAEIITHKQLGFHRLPIVLINKENFYGDLQAFFDEIIAKKFAKEDFRDFYYFANSAQDAVQYVEDYVQPETPSKWFENER